MCSEKIRICHVTSAHKSNDVRILEKECVSLAKLGKNDVYLIAKGNSYKYKGVSVIGMGNIDGNRIKRFIKDSKAIVEAAIAINADIYHLHDPELLLYVKKLKKMGKIVIFDSHEYYYEQILEKNYIPILFRRIIAKLYLVVENQACKYLDAVIFPCKKNGKHPFEGRAKRCVLIDNLPIKGELEDNKPKSGNFGRNAVVCCAGSLTPERGIENLIIACSKAHAKLILAGEISPIEFKEKLMSMDIFNGVVDYRGICNRKEINNIYQEATIGASTILDVGQYASLENFPTKVYEFMMAGLPFIISNFDYAKKVITKLECGICVNPNSVKEIADAIDFLNENRELAYKMGLKGKSAVENIFNWENEENKLYKLYEEFELSINGVL